MSESGLEKDPVKLARCHDMESEWMSNIKKVSLVACDDEGGIRLEGTFQNPVIRGRLLNELKLLLRIDNLSGSLQPSNQGIPLVEIETKFLLQNLLEFLKNLRGIEEVVFLIPRQINQAGRDPAFKQMPRNVDIRIEDNFHLQALVRI